MQTFSLFSRRPIRSSALLLAFALSGSPANAQTLARPGWAGSGMTAEAWWHNAIVYRIDVRAFQDSNGDGHGDLPGIVTRMDYLQSLGIDAIALDNLGDPMQSDSGFAEVLRAALPRHIRVLITLHDSPTDSDDNLAAQARLWLTRGAAGIDLQTTRPAEDAVPLLHLLRKLTDSFPGNRILLSEAQNQPQGEPATDTPPTPPQPAEVQVHTAPPPDRGTVHSIHLDDDEEPTQRISRPQRQAPRATTAPHTRFFSGAQLNGIPLELTNATAATLRSVLDGMNNTSSAGSSFLSEEMFSSKEMLSPANKAALDGRRRAFALVLLASRGAAAMRFGQEIGMLPTTDGADTAIMQWTPTNITVAATPASAAAPTPAPTPIPTRSDVYGTFKPYVAGPKPIILPQSADEAKSTSAAVPIDAPVDPATLPGFTTGTLPQPAPSSATTLNVATEDADPNSLLNLYRRLIALHHGNPALLHGQETLLDDDALGAIVWIRQPNLGSGTTSIIAVCNLSGAPLHLSLDQELKQHRIHTGSLRSLLSDVATPLSVQDTDDLTLPAYGVFLGQLYH